MPTVFVVKKLNPDSSVGLEMGCEEVSDEEFEEIKAAQGKGWDEKLQREIL